MVEDQESAAAWRKVIARAKKSMLKGALIVNPYGDRFDDPKHAYTPGALDLYRAGTDMLGFAGAMRYELGSTL